MTRDLFCECADALREYWSWECDLATMGIHLDSTSAAGLADAMLLALLEGNWTWDDDPVADWGWVGIWCGAAPDQFSFRRRSQWVYLPDAGALYDFVNEMRELGWPEWIENQRWLK